MTARDGRYSLSVDLMEETIEVTDSPRDSGTGQLAVMPLPHPLVDD